MFKAVSLSVCAVHRSLIRISELFVPIYLCCIEASTKWILTISEYLMVNQASNSAPKIAFLKDAHLYPLSSGRLSNLYTNCG